MTTPLVSVVIAAFNARKTIGDALDSVLAQSLDDWEVIVCDDGSTDGTLDVVRERLRDTPASRYRLLDVPHAGPAEARNRGIRDARGAFVAFLDDDDHWAPTKLARCIEAMHADSLDIVCHSEWWLPEDGSTSRVHHYSELFDGRVAPLVSLFRNNPFSTSAVVVRRERLLASGLFDPTLPSAEDYDLWIRLACLPGIRIGFIDEPLGVYRLRSGSESSKIDRRFRALMMIGERYSDAVSASSRMGRLEPWIYRAKTLLTTGVRYLQQGSSLRGTVLVTAGLLMWPLRLDLLRHATRRIAGTR